jgi:hypothetical protein
LYGLGQIFRFGAVSGAAKIKICEMMVNPAVGLIDGSEILNVKGMGKLSEYLGEINVRWDM